MLELYAIVFFEEFDHFRQGVTTVVPHREVFGGPGKIDRRNGDVKAVCLRPIQSKAILIRWDRRSKGSYVEQTGVARYCSLNAETEAVACSTALQVCKWRHIETVWLSIELEWIVGVSWVF